MPTICFMFNLITKYSNYECKSEPRSEKPKETIKKNPIVRRRTKKYDRHSVILKQSKNSFQISKPFLPTKCMQRILKYVGDQGDGKLYPLLFVNKDWCLNVAPLLWEHPFNNIIPSQGFKLVRIYLLCL